VVELLLGEEGRRRLTLRHKSNDELFTLYQAELTLRLHNDRDRQAAEALLERFQH